MRIGNDLEVRFWHETESESLTLNVRFQTGIQLPGVHGW